MSSSGLEGTQVSGGAALTCGALSWGWRKPLLGWVKNVIPRMSYGKYSSLILVSVILFCISQENALPISFLILWDPVTFLLLSFMSLNWRPRSSEIPFGGWSQLVCRPCLYALGTNFTSATTSLTLLFLASFCHTLFFSINLYYNFVSGTKSFLEHAGAKINDYRNFPR